MNHIKMGQFQAIFLLVIVILQQTFLASSLSRQKRCIVIQKQSGTHGDSTEGDDDRDIEPRKPPKKNNDGYDRRNHEKISPDSEFLRYKLGPTKKLDDVMRYKNKLVSFKKRFI